FRAQPPTIHAGRALGGLQELRTAIAPRAERLVRLDDRAQAVVRLAALVVAPRRTWPVRAGDAAVREDRSERQSPFVAAGRGAAHTAHRLAQAVVEAVDRLDAVTHRPRRRRIADARPLAVREQGRDARP